VVRGSEHFSPFGPFRCLLLAILPDRLKAGLHTALRYKEGQEIKIRITIMIRKA